MRGERNRTELIGHRKCEFEAGHPVYYWEPTCSGCDRVERVKCHKPNEHPVIVEKRLQALGWRVGQRLLCPDCLTARKSRPEPEAQPMSKTQPFLAIDPVVAVEEPRKPTPEDRRRVREALMDVYDEEACRYRVDGSDAKLAAKLDVPRIWVTELREAMGLGGDTCETRDAFDAELAAINGELATVSEDFLKRLGGVESRLRKLEIDRAYAGRTL